jgi:uncharacterized protein (DUF3084 family)
MKPSHISDKIISQRKKEIEIQENTLKDFEENVARLQKAITHKKDYLESYKKTLEKTN